MRKRILSLSLALVMLLTLLPMGAQAATVVEVVPCKYDAASSFTDGLARVAVNTGEEDDMGDTIYHHGFIDKTGAEVIPCKYDEAYGFSEDLAMVILDHKWGFIDRTGAEVIPLQYAGAWNFSGGITAVATYPSAEADGKQRWYLMDKTGALTPLKYDYDWVSAFSNGFAKASRNEKWGLIDKTGTEVVPCEYDNLYVNEEGLAVVSIGLDFEAKWGLIDLATGMEVVSPGKYNTGVGWGGYNFSEGLAAVRVDTGERDDIGHTVYRCGFIDRTGTEVSPANMTARETFQRALRV